MRTSRGGIRCETQRSALRTQELARQATDAFRLNLFVVYQEQIRWAKELLVKREGNLNDALRRIQLMVKVLEKAFPQEWPQIAQDLEEVTEDLKRGFQSQGQTRQAS